jgi:hypothetical protein
MPEFLCRAAILALSLGLAPALATAQTPPQGRFELDACTVQPFSDRRLEIRGLRMQFWESVCTLANPVTVRGMPGGYLYDAACSGEGETWSTRYLLMPGFQGRLVLVMPNSAMVYEYCGP